MSEPRPPRFQFGLRTLLLLFVVAASSLAVFGAWGLLVFGLGFGSALYLRSAESIRPISYGAVAIASVFVIVAIWHFVSEFNDVGPHYRPSCLNRMHQLGLALCGYREEHGHFPPAYTTDSDGKPLHSWRTLMLQGCFLQYDYFYHQIDLAQSWDSPRNKSLLSTPLREFACPSDPSSTGSTTAQTNYFAVVGPNSAWTSDKARTIADFRGQESHTIMLVEVANSGISWAEPHDFSVNALGVHDEKSNVLPMSSNHCPPDEFFFRYDRGTFVVAGMADGSVTYLRTDNLSANRLRKIFEIGGFSDDVIARQTGIYAGKRLNWPNIAALAVWFVSVSTLLTTAVRGRAGRGARLASESVELQPSQK